MIKRIAFIGLLLLFAARVGAVDIASGTGFGSSAASPLGVKQFSGTNIGADILNPLYFIGYAYCSAPASVGLKSVCQVLNPSGSGVWFIALTINCWVGSTSVIQLTAFNTPRTTPQAGGSTYNFATNVKTSAMQIYADAISANGTPLEQSNNASTSAGGSGVLAAGFTMLPGAGVEAEMQTANDSMNCQFMWEEIPPLQ